MIDNYHGNYVELHFTKKGSEIVQKSEVLAGKLREMIEVRKERIRSVCAEKNLKPEDLVGGIQDLSYANKTQMGLKVGDLGELQAESQVLNGEKAQLKKLELIIRNLPAEKEFNLSFDLLRYLGF